MAKQEKLTKEQVKQAAQRSRETMGRIAGAEFFNRLQHNGVPVPKSAKDREDLFAFGQQLLKKAAEGQIPMTTKAAQESQAIGNWAREHMGGQSAESEDQQLLKAAMHLVSTNDLVRTAAIIDSELQRQNQK